MTLTDGRVCSFLKSVSAIAVGFFILFSFSFNAFAYDDGYIKDSSYWNDKGESVAISTNTFQGNLKYAADKENGCFYAYLVFNDLQLNEKSDGAYLNFTIKNSVNEYEFSVGKDEVIADDASVVEDNFNVYSNFDKVNLKYGGGEIFVALEFKNSVDKTLSNLIECYYSGGKSNNILLKNDLILDMYVESTAKASTTRAAKQTTVKAGNEDKNITAKSSQKAAASYSNSDNASSKKKSKKETTTKFVPSSRKHFTTKTSKSKSSASASRSKASKFSKSDGVVEDVSSLDFIESTDESTTSIPTMITSDDKHMSREALALLIISLLVFFAGAVIFVLGLLAKKYKIVSVKNDEETDIENDEE